MKTYSSKDMVDVVDAAGQAIEGMPSVPKAWLDTDLVPAGTKKGKPATAEPSTASTTSPTTDRPARESGVEPPRAGTGSSTEEWVAYAKEKGATDADLLDDTAEPLTRDALIVKYGTPAS